MCACAVMRVGVVCYSDELLLWDINDKKKPSSKRLTGAGHNRAIFGITFLPDDPRHFVTHSMDRQVQEAPKKELSSTLMNHHHADHLVELRKAEERMEHTHARRLRVQPRLFRDGIRITSTGRSLRAAHSWAHIPSATKIGITIIRIRQSWPWPWVTSRFAYGTYRRPPPAKPMTGKKAGPVTRTPIAPYSCGRACRPR
jgi:hypothetical protein